MSIQEGGLGLSALNELLLSRSVSAFEEANSHDACTLRKPHTPQMECLNKVRSLEGGIINGYHIFYSVAIGKNRLHLLDCAPFSSKEENTDKKELTFEQISRVSQAFKEANEDVVLTHLIDREVEDAEFFNEVDSFSDRHVIRPRPTDTLI